MGPLLLALDGLLQEESLSPRGLEIIEVIRRGVKEEARAIAELLTFMESLETDVIEQTTNHQSLAVYR